MTSPHAPADTVLLDVDGTLIDSSYHHAIAWYRAFRRHGIDLPVWRVHRAIGMGGDTLVPFLVGDEVDERIGDTLRKDWLQEYTPAPRRSLAARRCSRPGQVAQEAGLHGCAGLVRRTGAHRQRDREAGHRRPARRQDQLRRRREVQAGAGHLPGGAQGLRRLAGHRDRRFDLRRGGCRGDGLPVPVCAYRRLRRGGTPCCRSSARGPRPQGAHRRRLGSARSRLTPAAESTLSPGRVHRPPARSPAVLPPARCTYDGRDPRTMRT